jgi:hypothetical protein
MFGSGVGPLVFLPVRSLGGFGVHWGTYALAVLVPFFYVRAQKALAREFAKKQAALHDQRTKIQLAHDAVHREKSDRQEQLERLQNRFALVQVMATKLEAGEILQTLGHMWRKRPGVKGCLILRRQLNGSWGTSFSDGHFNVQDWVAGFGVASRPWGGLAISAGTPRRPNSSRCRANRLGPPVSWSRSPGTKTFWPWAFWRWIPAGLEESTEGFNIERKLVSIGLAGRTSTT